MHPQKNTNRTHNKSATIKHFALLVLGLIVLVGLYIHVQNYTTVVSGAIVLVVAHIAVAGGFIHLGGSKLTKKRHRRPVAQTDSYENLKKKEQR